MAQQRFTAEHVDTLLARLGSDDAFRERMLGDPVGALGSLGLEVDPDTVPKVRTLPSKEAIRSNHDAIKSQITGRAGMIFFFVE